MMCLRQKKKSKTSAQSWCTRAVRLGPTRVSYSLSNLTPDAVSSSSNLNFFRFHFKILGLSAVWSSKPFVLDARWRPFLRQHPHRFKGAHQTHVLDFPCYLHALPTSKKLAFRCLLCVLHNQDHRDHRCLTSLAWSEVFRTYIPWMDIESSLKQHASTMHSMNRLHPQ